MPTLTSIIEDYSPPNGQDGVPLKSTIQIEFAILVDENSLREAFFMEGPDTDTVIGPDSAADIYPGPFGTLLGEEYDYLSSPGFTGLVPGDFTFSHSGGKTTMVFTPDPVLSATTSYKAHLTDLYSDSIGDVTPDLINGGNGTITAYGPWLGASDTLNIEITASGVAGAAEFKYYKSSNPSVKYGPMLSSARDAIPLEEGLFIKFGAGDFYLNDTFTASLSPAVLYSGHLTFEFDTGSGSIQSLPSTSSTSILKTLEQSLTNTKDLQVVRTIPANHQVEVDPNLEEIIIEFNKNLDASSVTDALVSVVAKIASSHPVLGGLAKGEIAKRITVSGRRITLAI
ncbi:hypothetical protein GF373_17510 [bacterium]|nr:hypothetical protein [bacterium]